MQPNPSNARAIAVLALCAVAATAAAGAAATSNLPTYPGAKKSPATPGAKTRFSTCGRTITVAASYETPANGKSVAQWYASKIPGAIVVDISQTDETSVNTQIQIYTPDGSQAAVISQMMLKNPKLQAAAKTIDADKTDIGFETFSPPVGADVLSLEIAGAHGDAAAKRKLAATCPGN